jgi:hypothetical protein
MISCVYLVQLNETDRVREADQISAHISSSSSTHLSNAMQDSQTIPASPSTQYACEKPKIVTNPKKDWKTRYPKDLIPKPKKEAKKKPRKQTNKKPRKQTGKESKFIGLLQGVGGQRSQIKVKVNRLVY